MSLTRYRWQKVVNELRFLYQEFSLCEEICTDAGPLFQKAFEKFCQENDIPIASKTDPIIEGESGLPALQDEKPPPSEAFKDFEQQMDLEAPEADEEEIHKIFHKLFRKIAMQLHPDKLSKDLSEPEVQQKSLMFTKAKKAIEDRRYFVLIDYAQLLNIETPTNYADQIKWMHRESQMIHKELSLKRITYGYQYAMCESDEQRRELIINFIKQTLGIEVK